MIDIYEVVKKLIGPIDPVGKSESDAARLENIKQLTRLVDMLVSDIDYVANHNKDRVEASMKAIGVFADKFMDSLVGPQ